MKDDKALNLLNYIENNDNTDLNTDLFQEAEALKDLVHDIKEVNVSKVDIRVDQKIHSLSESGPNNNRHLAVKKLLPFAAVAAVLLLILNLVLQPKNLDQAYNSLKSNPEKLGFIHELYEATLDEDAVVWLQDQLLKESNPNIRVAIVDIMGATKTPPAEEVFGILAYENVPSVQMAVLDYAKPYVESVARSGLIALAERRDLEPTVAQKVNELLSEIN